MSILSSMRARYVWFCRVGSPGPRTESDSRENVEPDTGHSSGLNFRSEPAPITRNSALDASIRYGVPHGSTISSSRSCSATARACGVAPMSRLPFAASRYWSWKAIASIRSRFTRPRAMSASLRRSAACAAEAKSIARKRSRFMDGEDTAATLPRESNGRSTGPGSGALVRLSRRPAGIRGLHVVREDALSGMRDAVGRHLALRCVPRGEARNRPREIARRRLDRGDAGLAPHTLSQREDHGLVRRAARGTPLIRAPLSTTAVLDEAADAVRLTAAPWGGLLIITALPYRFAQAIFADRLLAL